MTQPPNPFGRPGDGQGPYQPRSYPGQYGSGQPGQYESQPGQGQVPYGQPPAQPGQVPYGQPPAQPGQVPYGQPTSQPGQVPSGQPGAQPSQTGQYGAQPGQPQPAQSGQYGNQPGQYGPPQPPHQPYQHTPPPPKKKLNPVALVAMILVPVLLIGGVGYYFLTRNTTTTTAPPPVTATPTPSKAGPRATATITPGVRPSAGPVSKRGFTLTGTTVTGYKFTSTMPDGWVLSTRNGTTNNGEVSTQQGDAAVAYYGPYTIEPQALCDFFVEDVRSAATDETTPIDVMWGEDAVQGTEINVLPKGSTSRTVLGYYCSEQNGQSFIVQTLAYESSAAIARTAGEQFLRDWIWTT